MIFLMFGAYTLLFAGLVTTVFRTEYKRLYIAAKTAASLGFVFIFASAGIGSGYSRSFFRILPAFLFCFAGDILMACYNRYRKKAQFLTGLFLFLAGHLCFLRWMIFLQGISASDFVIPACFVLAAFLLTSSNTIQTGRLRPFILLYTFFIAMLFSKALFLLAESVTAAHLLIAGGAVLFFLSDISLLFLYFSAKKGAGIHVFNLLTYYYGMFFLAISPIFNI